MIKIDHLLKKKTNVVKQNLFPIIIINRDSE